MSVRSLMPCARPRPGFPPGRHSRCSSRRHRGRSRPPETTPAAGGTGCPVSSMMRMVSSGAASGSERVPEAQRFEETHRAVEQRDGAAVPARFQTADERRPVSVAREGERGAEPDRACTDDRDVEIMSSELRSVMRSSWPIRRSTIGACKLTIIRCIRHCR